MVHSIQIHQKLLFISVSRKHSNLKNIQKFWIANTYQTFSSFELATLNFRLSVADGKTQKETEDCVNYVKNRKLVMNFTILWNVHFFKCNRQLLIKQKYFQNPNVINLKNLMTSKNRQELPNMCKLIKDINKVCVLQARISYLLCKYCKYCIMTLYIFTPYCNLQCFMRITIFLYLYV